MSDQYAISHWPDSTELHEKLKKLVSMPMRQLTGEYKAKVKKWFEQNCAKSKQITDEAKQYIPGGVQHNLAFNHPWPLAITKAEGAFLYDLDGNKYIDFLQAGGPTILGSNYKPVQEKVIEVIKEVSPVTGLFHEYELKLAKTINKYMPAVEMFRALGTGTESDMAAIRVARTATGKKKIIKCGGAYHGWSDQLVYGLHIPGSAATEAVGIPKGCNKDTQEFPPNDLDKLRKMLTNNERKGGTAAILLEPLGPESGTNPVTRDFNKGVRQLCDEFGTLLIFDEVVTGFRVGMGGAQGYFGIKPDLTVFGKIVMGGYPMAGGLGGKKEYMSLVAAGVEGKSRAYVGGTLSANPMSCAAGYYAIEEIARTNACVKAGKAGDRLINGVQEIIDKYDLPYVAWNHASICHLETSALMLIDIMAPGGFKEIFPRKEMLHDMGAAYTMNGMITLAGSRIYTSMADTDEIIDDAISRFDEVMKNVEGVK